MFWLRRGHFSVRFGSQEGTLARVLPPKRTVYLVLTSQGCSLVCFANQERTLARFFGSQEGILAHVLAPRRPLYRMLFNNCSPPPPCAHHWCWLYYSKKEAKQPPHTTRYFWRIPEEISRFLRQQWDNLSCFRGVKTDDFNILFPVVSLMTKAGVFHGKWHISIRVGDDQNRYFKPTHDFS